MNTEKKELVNKLARLMDERGWSKDNDGHLGSDIMFPTSAKWLPLENLRKLLSIDVSDCKDYSAAYQKWGREGALKFEPYIVNTADHDNPSMCIRHDRFLHMFRGYYFQVSGTVDGIYSASNGSYHTNFLTMSGYYEKVLSKSLLAYLLWWAAMIDAGFYFDNFSNQFDNNRDVQEKFINASAKYWRFEGKYTWDDIEPYIEWSEDKLDGVNRRVFEFSGHGVICARFSYGYKTVQVETEDRGLLTITIPDSVIGTGYDLENEDDYEEYEMQVQTLRSNHYVHMILCMALKLSGINMNFMAGYSLSPKIHGLRGLNVPGIIKVEDLNDIYKVEPDEM